MIKNKHYFAIIILAFFAGLYFAINESYALFMQELLSGIINTVIISVSASALAVFLAFISALLKLYAPFPIKYLAVAYIEIFRGTSLLVQLFWLFFVLPHFNLVLDPFLVGILSLGLNIGAYGSEIVRSAILATPKGQWEVSLALNYTFPQTLVHIIIPQALIRMIPPWGNLFIELLKGSSLVSLITISDLSFKAVQLNQLTYETSKIYSLTLFFYLLLAFLITIGMHSLEMFFAKKLRK